MHASIIRDIKTVLDAAHSAIKKKNYFALEGLSNRLNHSLTIHQFKEISICAVTIYALSKIFDKKAYLDHLDFSKFRSEILTNLKFASTAIKKEQTNEYLQTIKTLQNQIEKFSNKLNVYQQPILSYARARKAKHAIEHGLSTSQASKLFKVPEWTTSKHIGKSTAHEKHHAQPKLNQQRIALVKKLFKLK